MPPIPEVGGTLYSWSELAKVPAQPGIYAWYYSIDITDRDVRSTISEVEEHIARDDLDAAKATITEFLDRFVFRYFTEAPFKATLLGPLKPRYEGEVSHQPTLSESLVERIVEEPIRIRTLQGVLRTVVPLFSSPIYIGMARNLHSRVRGHARLIQKYRDGINAGSGRDKEFAQRVVERELSPSRLRVAVRPIDVSDDEYVDAENVLNRINYPILGKN